VTPFGPVEVTDISGEQTFAIFRDEKQAKKQ
jgi:hypothetical protein